jgi:hypothetical protein
MNAFVDAQLPLTPIRNLRMRFVLVAALMMGSFACADPNKLSETDLARLDAQAGGGRPGGAGGTVPGAPGVVMFRGLVEARAVRPAPRLPMHHRWQ